MRSLWLQEALAGADDAPRLEGNVRADVCVVGGGYTGLWTALRLKELEPSCDVAVVEADVCGGGASGRNGGFVMSWWHKFSSLAKLVGTEEALRLARAAEKAVGEIGAFCAEHGIDAGYRADGWLWAASSPAQVGAWRGTVAELERTGVRPFEELAPAAIDERAGTSTLLAGILEPTMATVQPALLARGLRRVALERGVRIFERSPMTGLDRWPPRVRTPGGSISAGKLVLATGAWSARVRELRRALIVVSSDIVATEPLTEPAVPDGLGISDSRLRVHYWRGTRDGRLVLGKGGGTLAFAGRVGSAFEGASPRKAEVTAGLRALYPALASVPVATSWAGPIDRTVTGLPFFGPLGGRPEILAGVGYSGVGVCQSLLGGRILASLALERDDEWSAAGLVRGPAGTFPPEPVRLVGGILVRSAVTRKERAEDAGRTAGRLTLALASLAPPGMVPTLRKRA